MIVQVLNENIISRKEKNIEGKILGKMFKVQNAKKG